MKIRKYSLKDMPACMAIFNSNCPKYFALHELKSFENWLTNAQNYYVIEENNQIIGCGGYDVNDKENKVALSWGMIHKDFHKKGFGRKSIEYRLELIKKLKKDFTIVLDTSQHTHKFYEKLGFKVDKITKNHYGKGLDRYDMSMQLT